MGGFKMAKRSIGRLINELKKNGVSEKVIGTLLRQGNLRCSFCNRILDYEDGFLVCEVYLNTGNEKHTSFRIN
jgi:hypothetical protein